jgi:hypothetical protein
METYKIALTIFIGVLVFILLVIIICLTSRYLTYEQSIRLVEITKELEGACK